MFKKILFIGIILLLTINIATAYEYPNNFKKHSENFYTNGEYGISVSNLSSTSTDFLFKNDTDYFVHKHSNNTWDYTDALTHQVGVLEVIPGNVVVEVYCNGSNVDQCYKYLAEFNKLNNVNPVEFSG